MTASPPAPAPPAPPPAPTPPAPTLPALPPAPEYTAPQTQADLDRIIGQRLNQERAKYGGLTAEQVAELKTKAEQAEAANATDVEKREKAARDAATAEVEAKYRPQMAETAFRIGIGDSKPAAEVDEFIADLNLTRFLKDDGSVDTAKVLSRVKEFVGSGKAPGPPPKGPVVPGHNPGGPPPAAGGTSAQAWLEKQGIKPPA